MIRIPFTLPDDGFREVKGLAFIEEGRLILRVHSKLFGLLDKNETEIEIEPGALEDVYLHKGLIRDRLVVRPLGPELLDAVPGEHASELRLKVSRKYRKDLRELLDSFWMEL